MTRLGQPTPKIVKDIKKAVVRACSQFDYTVVDAGTQVEGRDFLIKIWKMIAMKLISPWSIQDSAPIPFHPGIVPNPIDT